MQQLHHRCSRQPFRLEVYCSSRHSRRSIPNNSSRRWGHINRSRDTPIRRYLRSTLALKDTLLDQSLACAPDLSSVSELEVQALVDPNYELLGKLAPVEKVRTVVCRNPRLLLAPLTTWHTFCRAYCECTLDCGMGWSMHSLNTKSAHAAHSAKLPAVLLYAFAVLCLRADCSQLPDTFLQAPQMAAS